MPSYVENGWRVEKNNNSIKLQKSNYFLLHFLFQFFIPPQIYPKKSDNILYMSEKQLNLIKYEYKQNMNILPNVSLISSVSELNWMANELNINYFQNSFQPMFDYEHIIHSSANKMFGSPIIHSFRYDFIQFCLSQFSDYKWIDSLLSQKYFCFAFQKKMYCNERSDIKSYANTKQMELKKQSFLMKIKGKLLLRESSNILYFSDRWDCWSKSELNVSLVNECKCIKRCIAEKMRNQWIEALMDAFPDWIIIYGNLGYLSFETQFHLMRNVRLFVGVHGSAFAWQLFMNMNVTGDMSVSTSAEALMQKVFELRTKTSEHLSIMLYGKNESKKYYQSYFLITDELEMYHDVSKELTFNISSVLKALKQFVVL